MGANNVRLTFNKQDIANLIMVIDWGLSGYDDEKRVEELSNLMAKLMKAERKFYEG
jgi:hypothetical protein